MAKKAEKISVSETIVRALEAKGVKYIFGVPGEEVEDLLFAIEKSSIQFVPTRHEQGAAFMADVWGRITGEAGVCLSTLGPGATNLLTGLADAHMDKSPVLAITGQADSARLHKESHQYIDVAGIFKPVTKWNTVIHNPHVAHEAVMKALKLAEEEKPGVTHIDLPEDVAEMEVSPVRSHVLHRKNLPKPHHDTIHEAIMCLEKSVRPVIFVGNGVIRARASKELREFSELLNVPVVTTFMGKGIISDRSPLSLHTAGLKSKDIPVMALEKSDLVITIGYDIAEFDPSFWNRGDAKIIHIDSESSEIYSTYRPALEIIADIKETICALSEEAIKNCLPSFSDWYLPYRHAIEKDIASYGKQKGKGISIPFVLSELRKTMKDGDILLSDVGSHKMWIARNFPAYVPNTVLISNGLASMGIALPGGMAAKLAEPEKRVVSLMGDGGFLMNSQEIETAKRMKVPFTIVVVNDNDYGLISWKQTASRGRSVGTKLGNPDFVKYAESFGIKAYKAKTAKDVGRTLKKAIESDELSLVIIDVDPSANMELTKKLKTLKI